MDSEHRNNPDLPPEQFSDHETTNSERFILGNEKYFATVSSQLDADLAETLWQINQAGFAELNAASLMRQNMARAEYDRDVADPGVLKYVIYAKGDEAAPAGPPEAAGMLFVHARAPEVGWINQAYMRQRLPDFERSGHYSYISTLVIEQNQRGIEASGLLIRAVGQDLYERQNRLGQNIGAIVDFAKKNESLPGYIDYCLRAPELGPPIPAVIERLGGQSYEMVETRPAGDTPSGVEVASAITDAGRAEALWQHYDQVSGRTEAAHPGAQRLSREEFIANLADERVQKVIFPTAEGEVALMAASDPALLDKLSSQGAAGIVGDRPYSYLFGAGAYESLSNEPKLAQALGVIAGQAYRQGGVLLYDIDESAHALRHVISQACGHQPRVIDHQDYWLIRPKPAGE